MGSKVAVLVAHVLATILLISSEVAAKELAETSDTVEPSEEIDRLGRGFRGGYGGYGGRYDGGYRGGYGGLCRFGCCGRGYYGGCRCCKYAGEMPDAEPQN